MTVFSGAHRGSLLSLILFIVNSAEVIGIVEQHSFNVHTFAAQYNAILLTMRMSTCIEIIKTWLSSIQLCFNPSKTELIWLGSSHCLLHWLDVGMYRIFGIIRYPAKIQVSGWIRYPIPSTKQYPVLSGILYPVESHTRYYPVHYQLLSNTAATDFYGI